MLPLPDARRGAGGAAPARRRLRPARPRRRRRHARSPTADDLAAGAGRRARRCRSRDEVASATSSTSPGPPAQSPSLALGRQPARRDRAAARGEGLGLADRPRLRHPRRRQGAGPRRRCATGSRLRPEAELEGVDGRRQVLDARARLGPGPALTVTAMAITGRVPLLVLLGAACAVVLRRAGRHGAGSWLALVACSWLRRRPARWRRRPAAAPARAAPTAPVRLGEPAATALAGRATRRRGGVRGVLRDAWQPSRRAPPATGTGSTCRPASDRASDDHAACPPGAATAAPTGSPCAARAARPGRPAAARIAVAGHGPRRCRRSTSRKHLPSRLARLRELDGRAAVRVRGQGTEFDSLREYVRGDDVRSIDWRASARSRDVVVRTWQPERDRRVVLVLDTGAHLGRPGRRRARGSTPRWTPRCCWPRSPRAPATGSTSSPATARCAPASRAAAARDVLRRLQDAMADARAGARRGRLARAGRRRSTAARPAARAGRAAHPARAVRGRGGAAAGAAAADRAPPGGRSRRSATPRWTGSPPAAATPRRGVRRRRGRAGDRARDAHRRAARARSASTSSTRTPTGCRWPRRPLPVAEGARVAVGGGRLARGHRIC